MAGTITGFTGTTLVMSVSYIGGSGTYTDWSITATGAVYSDPIAIGAGAGSGTFPAGGIAIGLNAASTSQGSGSVAIGSNSASTQGAFSVAIGSSAGGASQGTNSISIGYVSGGGNQSASIGTGAGSSADSVFVGHNAGNVSGANSVCIGSLAANKSGTETVSVGYRSGVNFNGTTVATGFVAVGYQANYNGSNGISAIIVGQNSVAVGRNTQCWDTGGVAIGNAARSRGIGTVAIGDGAGGSGFSVCDEAVMIGKNAGSTGTAYTISIGTSANAQAVYSIAIGRLSSVQVSDTSSIVINASGSALTSDGSNRFYVSPIRQLAVTGLYAVYYNPTTKEITYSTVAS
jgi:hypothetical protein